VACRSSQPDQAKQPKRHLIRLVRTPAGHVEVDPTGKRAGRGAYLCADPACWDLALTKGALARALHTTLTNEDLAALRAFAATVPEPELVK
jgi:hypothetical protein